MPAFCVLLKLLYFLIFICTYYNIICIIICHYCLYQIICKTTVIELRHVYILSIHLYKTLYTRIIQNHYQVRYIIISGNKFKRT